MAKKPIEYVEIEVDGRPLTVRKDENLLWSLRDQGFDIPHFCAHHWLEPFAGCRMCLVQIEMGGRMMPKLQPSCAMKPAEGMKVFTEVPEVITARREQMEFHLINHPLECPVCDKGGECMLQDQVYAHGSDEGRFLEEKRVRDDKVITDYIRMNYKRCIQCKRCVHFCQDIDGSHRIKFVQRGADTRIEGFPEPGVADRFSGNTIDICPVGALTARSYRFMGRPWEQDEIASVGSLDSLGANISICGRLGEIARLIPRDNPGVENGLIDDVTRFSWQACHDPRRITKAIRRKKEGESEISLFAGEEQVAQRLLGAIGEYGPNSIGLIAGSELNTEEYLALKKFCSNVLETSRHHLGDELFGKSTDLDVAFNSLTKSYAPISDVLACSTVLTIGCDLFEEAPALGLRLDIAARRGHLKLLSAHSHKSDIDRFADVIASYGFGNQLRFIRGLANGIRSTGDVPEEVKTLIDPLKAIGDDVAIVYGYEIWRSENPIELIQALEDLRAAISEANPDAQDCHLCPIYPAVNSVGAMVINWIEHFAPAYKDQYKPAAGSIESVLQAAVDGDVKVLMIFDADLMTSYPDRSLVEKALSAVVATFYCGPFANPTSEMADVHLPLGTYAHRQGTVVSSEWRVQVRNKAAISKAAPSVHEVLNSIAVLMSRDPVVPDEQELSSALASLLNGWPGAGECPEEGLLWKLPTGNAGGPPKRDVPAEVKGTAEYPLMLIPKRFIYNDRPEVKFSPVFDDVAKPFKAFLNPIDMKVNNIAAGDMIQLAGIEGSLELSAASARWVNPGSVVVNDHYLEVPANRLAGTAPVRVAARRKVEAVGGQ